MNSKILITGASSYLAHRLVPIAARYGEVYGVSRKRAAVVAPAVPVEFDLSRTERIARMVEAIRPTAVIHAAAVNPGDPDALMEAVNHLASGALAEAAVHCGSRFVMVSTGSVHSGLSAPYSDEAEPDPVNRYGQTKAAGERQVMLAAPEAVIVRTSLIYGLDLIDRGTRGFRDRLLQGQPLKLFDDVYRQPVWVDSLSHALCELALNNTRISGTMNLVGTQTMSRAAFGMAMMNYWGIDTRSNISMRSGADVIGVQPDLTCTCERADALQYPRPGVTEVLRNLAAR